VFVNFVFIVNVILFSLFQFEFAKMMPNTHFIVFWLCNDMTKSSRQNDSWTKVKECSDGELRYISCQFLPLEVALFQDIFCNFYYMKVSKLLITWYAHI